MIAPAYDALKLIDLIEHSPAAERPALIARIEEEDPELLDYALSCAEQLDRWRTEWHPLRHDAQRLPDRDEAWRTFLIRCGRGFGKTWFGARLVIEWALELGAGHRIALLAANVSDGRKIMAYEVMKAAPSWFKPVVNRTDQSLKFPNGCEAIWLAAEAPDSPRGFTFSRGWADELAKWKPGREWASEFWDNYEKSLRGIEDAYTVITTTPRPSDLLRDIQDAPDTITIQHSSFANPHLPKAYIKNAGVPGTARYRQEIEGELVQDVSGSFWTYDDLSKCVLKHLPELTEVVIGVDPALTNTKDSDDWGIVIAGRWVRDGETSAVILADFTGPMRPNAAVDLISALVDRYEATRVIYEGNVGGEAIRDLLLLKGIAAQIEKVTAHKAKAKRAADLAARYANGEVWHFPKESDLTKLEKEQAEWHPGLGRSPNRIDAAGIAVSAILKPPKKIVRCWQL